MRDPENEKVAKRSYEPPKMVTVSLRPEEAVLGNCKISGNGGPGHPGCNALPICMTIGS